MLLWLPKQWKSNLSLIASLLDYFFVLPLCVGIFSYYNIFLKTHEHQQNVVSSLRNCTDNTAVSNTVKEIKLTLMLLLVAPLCCWICGHLSSGFVFPLRPAQELQHCLSLFYFIWVLQSILLFMLSQMASSKGNFANCSVAAVKGQELCQRKLLRLLVTISSNERNKKQTFKSNEFVLIKHPLLKTVRKSYSILFFLI